VNYGDDGQIFSDLLQDNYLFTDLYLTLNCCNLYIYQLARKLIYAFYSMESHLLYIFVILLPLKPLYMLYFSNEM